MYKNIVKKYRNIKYFFLMQPSCNNQCANGTQNSNFVMKLGYKKGFNPWQVNLSLNQTKSWKSNG